MKILYYSPHPNLNNADDTGYATHINEMINAFEDLGHKVLPLIMGGREKRNVQEIQTSFFKKILKKIIHKYIWESLKDINLRKFDIYAKSKLIEKVKKFAPDIIYERANYFQSSGVEVAKQFKIKHILEVNSPYVEERINLQGKSFFLKKAQKIEKKILLNTDRILVVSSSLKDYFLKKYHLNEKKIFVTPNAININKIKIDENLKLNLIKKYDLKDKIVIGFVGSFFKWHGIDLLINAFKVLNNKYENIKLLIVGDGDIFEELKELSSNNKNIIFTGSIKHKNIFSYIDLMNISVMAKTNWYGSPVKIFEYGIMEKAIIAPNEIPLKDVMTNKKDGLLIESDVKSLTDAIEFYIENKNLMKDFALSFKNKIIKHRQWINNVEIALKTF